MPLFAHFDDLTPLGLGVFPLWEDHIIAPFEIKPLELLFAHHKGAFVGIEPVNDISPWHLIVGASVTSREWASVYVMPEHDPSPPPFKLEKLAYRVSRDPVTVHIPEGRNTGDFIKCSQLFSSIAMIL